jgi:hypothetical protein
MREVNPVERLLQMSAGYYVARCLHAAANLGVADALDETPRTSTALAEAAGANPPAVDRMLRLLAAYDIFEYRDGLIAHTPTSRLLRSDHPQTMRPLVRMFGSSGLWDAAGDLEYSVCTGLPSADKVLDGGIWGYLSRDPVAGRIFNDAMTAKAHGQVAGVVASYDFSGFTTVADIGGGRGHLLQAVLASAPRASGILFDQPQVLEEVASIASSRLALRPGDFFKDPLPVCDAYLIMEVIHDWDDKDSAKILRAIRRAAPPHARLLLIEALLPDDPGPNWPKTLDIVMLIIGGRQRTLVEYEALLDQTGFSMMREIATPAGVSIIEAAPV